MSSSLAAAAATAAAAVCWTPPSRPRAQDWALRARTFFNTPLDDEDLMRLMDDTLGALEARWAGKTEAFGWAAVQRQHTKWIELRDMRECCAYAREERSQLRLGAGSAARVMPRDDAIEMMMRRHRAPS